MRCWQGYLLVCFTFLACLPALLCDCHPFSAGSLLLESLKDHISTTAQDHCKAIYLHVLTTNNTAINFYENRDFKQHHYLPYYYSIRGVLKDGFTYVLYINGGHPPWTILYPLLFKGEGCGFPATRVARGDRAHVPESRCLHVIHKAKLTGPFFLSRWCCG